MEKHPPLHLSVVAIEKGAFWSLDYTFLFSGGNRLIELLKSISSQVLSVES